MWRKAAVATIVLIVLMTITGGVFRAVMVSVVEGERSLWTDLGGTKGSFIYLMIWVGRIFEVAITFGVIWWALQSTRQPPERDTGGRQPDSHSTKPGSVLQP